MRKTTAIADNCVAKWMVFLRDGILNNISKHKLVTLCTKCRPILGPAGSAGPRGPATWTDTEGFFFLERASPTPPWIRPLFCNEFKTWDGQNMIFYTVHMICDVLPVLFDCFLVLQAPSRVHSAMQNAAVLCHV